MTLDHNKLGAWIIFLAVMGALMGVRFWYHPQPAPVHVDPPRVEAPVVVAPPVVIAPPVVEKPLPPVKKPAKPKPAPKKTYPKPVSHPSGGVDCSAVPAAAYNYPVDVVMGAAKRKGLSQAKLDALRACLNTK